MALRIAKWLFLLLVVSLPLVRPFNLFIFDLQVPYTDLIFLLVFAFWGLAVILRQTKLRFDRIFFFISLYALAFTISAVVSVNSTGSFHKLLGEYYLFALCFLTFELVGDKTYLKHVLMAWLVGTILTVLASFLGFALFYIGYKTSDTNYFLSHFGSLPAGNYPRIHALFANANMLCNFLNISVILPMIAAKLGWIKVRTAVILLVGIAFSAIFSISPGLGGIALTLGLWFWFMNRTCERRRLAAVVLAAAVVIAVAAFASTLISPDTDNTAQEIKLPFVEKTFEPSVRVLVWENTVDTIRQFPYFGKGTGVDVVEVHYKTLSGSEQILGDAHNMYLNILAQIGIVGFAAFVLMLIQVFRRCRFGVAEYHEARYLQIGLSCAFVGAFLYQGLAGSFEDARHIWILIGMIAAVSNVGFSNSESGILPASTEP